MLVLLPPSEGKAAATGRRRPVDVPALSFPTLTAAREQVLDALVDASARPDATRLLDVGPSLVEEVARNTRIRTLPARPAAEVYTGVLYAALGLGSLPTPARRTANRSLVVVSALWGALRPTDAVPPYRVSVCATLPGVGALEPFWRPRLDGPLSEAAGDGLVVDCRSTSYQAMWMPRGPLAARTVGVRVLREQDGRRSVVSHMAKHTRGQVVRHLLLRGGRAPRTPAALAAAVGEAFQVELTTAAGRPVLEVVVRG